MGKQTNAIVYYCDNCKKSIIGTPNINKTAEHVAAAHNVPITRKIEEQNIPFSPNQVNAFKIIQFDVEPLGEEAIDSITLGLKGAPHTLYYCKECAEKIFDEYIELTGKIASLFE